MLAVTAFAVPGLARAALTDCASAQMCLWGNNDFNWKIADRSGGSGTITILSGSANNQMDSWANRSGYVGCMYGASNGTGGRQTMGANSNDNNVAPWNSDEVSSLRTRYGC